MMSGPGLTARLAAFACDSPPGAAPACVREIARLSLADWLACALAATGEPVARTARKAAEAEGGVPQASTIGTATRLPARAAALVNATTGHALDYDDTHFLHIGHVTTVVAPAALAVAEREGATLAAALDACLLGAEAACRIGDWLGRAHYNAGFHQTGTAGAFGATLAAARLMGLDTATATHALGLASTRAGGLKTQFGTMGKPLNAGFAAATGVECATLAALGATSCASALERPRGFAETHAGALTDPAAALDGLGETWVFASVSHKLHACCHGTHAALEALARLRDSLDPAGVERVTIATNPCWMTVCDIARPATGLEAKFSYRLTAAMALTGTDTAAMASFDDALCIRPDLVALRDRVEAVADPAVADTAARVSITTRDGRRLDAAHDLAAPTEPATRARRLRAKAEALIGAPRTEALWSALAKAGPDTPARMLGALLARPPEATARGAA
ncbi:MAG: MmgE/PrpD family protein [Pseudomonadota bacterium]